MKNTLIIIGHPHFDKSIANKAIIEILKEKIELEKLDSNIRFRNLIELYPNYKIDIRAEQEALIWAENIVLQFPLYWYNVPAILKLWMDEVLEYGFAYGKTGNKLNGKNLLFSFTTGGPQESYSSTGRNNFEISSLLNPHKQTSNLMGCNFLNPVCSHSMINQPTISTNFNELKEKSKIHANIILETINNL